MRKLGDEEGFTVTETVTALGVILASLVALAYTSTVGFSDIAYARQRQAATGLANQAMEDVRALPFATLQKGLDNTDLAKKKDPNITQSGTEYYYAGERIPRGNNAPVIPLVPHQASAGDGTASTYTISTYVTYYQNQLTSNTYRVTVVVTWNAQGRSHLSSVQTQSLFYSGSGCVSASTHPFAAPCQPFFFASAEGAEGHVTFTGSLQNTQLDNAQLRVGAATSDMQIEQMATVQGTTEASGVSLKLTGQNEQVAGAQPVTSGADNDPAQPGHDYMGTTLTGGPATTLTAGGGGEATLSVTSSAGDAGSTASTTSASISPPHNCPDSKGVMQTDAQPCGSSNAQQNGTESAVVTFQGEAKKAGSVLLASTAPSPSKLVGFTDRAVSPEVNICPATSGDGCVHTDTTRSWGQLTLAGLPDGFSSAPAGWLGYLVAITNLSTSASAETGVGAAVPTVSVSGTIWYWNGSGYTGLALAAGPGASIPVTALHYQQAIDGKVMTVDIVPTLSTGGTVLFDPAGCNGACTRTDASSTANSALSGDISYTVTFSGQAVFSLDAKIDLGATVAKATYKASPNAG